MCQYLKYYHCTSFSCVKTELKNMFQYTVACFITLALANQLSLHKMIDFVYHIWLQNDKKKYIGYSALINSMALRNYFSTKKCQQCITGKKIQKK